MLHRYGAFVARHARLLLVIGVLAMIGAGVLGAGAFSQLRNGGFQDPRAESTRAQQLINQRYGGGTNLVLLVTSVSGTVDSPDAVAAGRHLTEQLAAEPDVTQVASYWSTGAAALKSTDGTEAIVVGHVTGDDTQVTKRA